jgi:two-component system, NtrC family, response regulator PilR
MADSKPVVLVVDDESSIRESFALILGKEFNVITASSGEAALKRLIDVKIDMVYLDMKMSGMNGIDTLRRIKEIDRDIDVVMVTAVNEVGSASSAIKLGAKDYVVKPFDVNDILNRTRTIVIKSQTRAFRSFTKDEVIGQSRQMQEVKKQLEEIVRKDVSVLIRGEKGVESHLIARFIASENEKDLKVLLVSADMKPAALFGREKGSFTGDFSKMSGALEEAGGGILFLRNVDLMPYELQVKLRDALKAGEIMREGSLSKIALKVRLISETSVDLKEMVKEGTFDGELLRMIGGASIELPPLRIREGDVQLIAEHYTDKLGQNVNKNVTISAEAKDILSSYSWPGNTAELVNVIESMILNLKGTRISPDDIPLNILIDSGSAGKNYATLDHIGTELEKAHIEDVLKRAGDNKEKAAAMLGIKLKTLESRLETVS